MGEQLSVVFAVGLGLAELATTWLLVVVLIRASRRVARRTQRTSGSVATIVFGLTLVVMALLGFALYWAPPLHDWLTRPSDAGLIEVVAWVLAWWGSAELVALVIVVFALPSARRFAGSQRSNTPYRTLIIGAKVGTGVVPVVMLLVGSDWTNVLRVLGAGVTLTGYLTYRRARARPIDARAEMEHDSRPLVLYLRPFEEDVELFAEQPMPWRRIWSEYYRLSSGDRSSQYFETFEEFFAGAVRAGIGPFVALGNPADRIAPHAAARVYFTDTTWQDEFVELLGRAGYIIATCRLSQSTSWEIHTVRRLQLTDRLFLVTSPPPPPSRPWGPGRALKRTLLSGSLDKVSPPPARPWATTVADYAQLGLRLPPTDPGPGAVLGFTTAGRAMVLSSAARTPEQYVSAIRQGPSISGSDPRAR